MKQKIIPYGTTHKVEVLSATEKLIAVVDENNEGYLLVFHGMKQLPNVGDKGKITFVRNNTRYKGHWQYESLKQSA